MSNYFDHLFSIYKRSAIGQNEMTAAAFILFNLIWEIFERLEMYVGGVALDHSGLKIWRLVLAFVWFLEEQNSYVTALQFTVYRTYP